MRLKQEMTSVKQYTEKLQGTIVQNEQKLYICTATIVLKQIDFSNFLLFLDISFYFF